jgi:outer membrane murein-binding lipoprotein Lpp
MRVSMWIAAVLAACLLAGCGGSGGIDENKPLDQVAAEAAEMNQEKLQEMVDKYEAALAGKTAEMEALKEELNSIPLKDMMGDEARALKEDLSGIMDSVDALTKQMKVYAKELAEQ